jgi:hypothetical protein
MTRGFFIVITSHLCGCNIVSGFDVYDPGCQGVPSKVRPLVVVLQEVLKKCYHVVALSQDGPSSHKRMNNPL